ncbi:hypothetical protein HK100_000109 [Physocladia obscura]|uniref:LicD/FKTN/FKRP nucleotidyltransferase domain-containing protein n=1 Tax=Physocladia obscura TaxID=109957 RepID=A0AAD5T0B1_9FUNG|nr:hypothetical protein HK100_000109 [Physocladia obscura]
MVVPLEHFGLAQPPPPLFRFDAAAFVTDAKKDLKHFHECGQDLKRDTRFADKKTCLPKKQNAIIETIHNATQSHTSLVSLLRVWSAFADRNNIAWWISHGELLGWFWNAKLLPWDHDLDIQMSTFQVIQMLAFNGWVLEDRFLIDVGPGIAVRSPQKRNTIDARIVDTQTGYFIDITGLSQLVAHDNDDDGIAVVSCKSPHAYKYGDLFPLVETRLEGIWVWRPNAAINILAAEYGEKALLTERILPNQITHFYHWDKEKQSWIMDLVSIYPLP